MALRLSKQPCFDFIEYNKQVKRMSGVFLISVIFFITAIIILYAVFLRKLEMFQGTWVTIAFAHIKAEVFSSSALGLFYIMFFGGLFFLFVPVEAFFVASITTGKFSSLHAAAIFAGLLLSYSLNYIIGLRLSKLSKNIVSAKKFYKTKVLVNRYGKLAIIFFNLVGMGSQQLTFVLGVFRYNKTRIFIFSLIGQLLKYGLITASIIWVV